MGIDARLLIRYVPHTVVTDEWLKEMSWKLCESIGAKHFFTSDGLPPEEFERASAAWNAAFKAHDLNQKWEDLNKAASNWKDPDHGVWHKEANATRAEIHADIGPYPKAQRLAIERSGCRYREEDDPPPGGVYHQDGDPIKADEGECLLTVSLWSRYYGEGYERGDILTICAVAEWLELHIPWCRIWYGGDSSGVLAEPFPDLKRQQLRNHLYSNEGRDYYRRDFGTCANKPPACSRCPKGQYRGSQFGSGRNDLYAAFHCPGCGESVKTEDGGKTWTEHKDE